MKKSTKLANLEAARILLITADNLISPNSTGEEMSKF
jgi:hypothetical protein